MHGKANLLSRSEVAMDELLLQYVVGRLVVVGQDVYAEQPFRFATEEGEDAVRGGTHGVLFPVEPRLVFACFLLFVLDYLGAEHGTALEKAADAVACLCIFADALGNDVACTGQGILDGGNPFVGVDILRGHLLDVAGVLLLQFIGQGFQSPLYGHGGAGAALGLVGEVEVFELGERGGGKDLSLQFRGEFALLADGG